MPGRIAPRAMAWRRRMGGIAGPLSASGEASNDNPVQVEMLISGAWVDITSYVMVRDNSGNIAITRGRRDEGSHTDQSTCELLLNNRDGRWSPRNPAGAYYGLIGRNQTIRVSVPDGLGGKSYRFWGEVSVWPQGWDPTGTDVWTDLQASGILRRLSQGPESAHSVIYNALTDPVADSLMAYWPMEDVSGATELASALTNGSAMTFSGTPDLAAYSDFPASDPVPLTDATAFTGGVARYDDPTAMQVRFLCFIPSDGLTDGKVICAIDQLDYSAGSPQFWELYYSTTSRSLILRQCDSDGNVLGAELSHTYDVRGKKMYISVEFAESGASITRAVRILELNSMVSYDVTDTAAASALTRVTSVQFGPASRSAVGPFGTLGLSAVAVGQVTVENAITSITFLGLRLNPIGEAAGRRIERLCGEEGIAFGSVGDLDDTAAMGNQGKQKPLDLMEEAEDADGGVLYENMQVLGLGYRTRNSLCNQDPQLTLSYTGYNLSEVPTPVEDDRYIQNRVIVTVNGVSETYELADGVLSVQQPPTGVGVYGQEITLNLESATQALDQAAWRVHLGTVDEPRYPQISVNLAHSSFTANPALKQAVLGLRQGDRIVVQNPPSWLPPGDIDQIILGFSETITHFEHRVTFICAPASPYTVGVLDTADARIDTDGSELLTAVGSSDTEVTVIPSAGVTTLWTTADADAPWDIRVGGEVMTVTYSTSYIWDPFTRTESNGWGAANSGQTWTVNGSVADYAVNGTLGTTTHPSTGIAHLTTIASPGPDVDLYCYVGASVVPAGNSLHAGPIARAIDNNNHYMCRLEFDTGGFITVTIRKRVGGSETVLGTYEPDTVHTGGTLYSVRFQCYGSTLRAKMWDHANEIEPDTWHIQATDSSLPEANSVGTRSFSNTGNTDVNPQLLFDNFDLRNIQTLGVTRSVNGVVKSHSVGSDVRLAHPTILAL